MAAVGGKVVTKGDFFGIKVIYNFNNFDLIMSKPNKPLEYVNETFE